MARLALGQRRPGLPLPGLVCDPACGAGALLLPPLRQHLCALADADPRVTLAGLPRLIHGRDADPAAVWIANVVLASELLPLVARIPQARRRPLPLFARVGDGLNDAPREVRAVVMNPPYGRVRLEEAERTRWGSYLYGHANLYSLFLAAALESLGPDGVLAALVPTSWVGATLPRSAPSLRGRHPFAALRSSRSAAECSPASFRRPASPCLPAADLDVRRSPQRMVVSSLWLRLHPRVARNPGASSTSRRRTRRSRGGNDALNARCGWLEG